MRLLIAAAAGIACALTGVSASISTAAQGRATAGDCVTIGKPKPTATYVSEHQESTGKTSTVTQVWESVSETGSRLKWTGPAGSWLQVNEHRIVDDVSVLDRTSKQDLNGMTIEATTFRPGIVGDPAFRACAGRTWPIPAVTAYFQAGTLKVTSQTPTGTLKIVTLHERVTVPAGTFDAVRYIRTSQSTDEYWKSIEHGVVVKHIGKVNGQTITETLISIK
jgi:hypothetical protein